MRAWLAGLARADRLIVLLHFADGLDAGEIAAVTGIEEKEVRERMRQQRLELDEIGLAAARLRRRWSDDPGARESARAGLVFSVGEVAAICACAPRTVTMWCDSGLLESYRLPGCRHRRIPRKGLGEFLAQHEIPSQRPDLYPGSRNG